MGSWSNKDEIISLEIDWQKIGFSNPESTTWQVPGVEGLQEEKVLDPGKPFVVNKEEGLFLIISEN